MKSPSGNGGSTIELITRLFIRLANIFIIGQCPFPFRYSISLELIGWLRKYRYNQKRKERERDRGRKNESIIFKIKCRKEGEREREQICGAWLSRSFNCRFVCVFKSLELSIIAIIQAGLFLGIDTWKMCICIVGTTFVIMCCEQVYVYTCICIVIHRTTTIERWRPVDHRQTDCVSNVHKYKSHSTWKKR